MLADAQKNTDYDRDKMICKRFIETGSLVRGYRVCKTKREWQQDRDTIRQGFGTASACSVGDGRVCRQ